MQTWTCELPHIARNLPVTRVIKTLIVMEIPSLLGDNVQPAFELRAKLHMLERDYTADRLEISHSIILTRIQPEILLVQRHPSLSHTLAAINSALGIAFQAFAYAGTPRGAAVSLAVHSVGVAGIRTTGARVSTQTSQQGQSHEEARAECRHRLHLQRFAQQYDLNKHY